MIIKLRNISIGDSFIPVQTMIKNPIKETKLTINKIIRLASLGCDIIRIAIPDSSAIKYLKEILKQSPIPVVADIHFDYRLAIQAIEAGVDKVRINPGNIGDESKIKKVIECLKAHQTPVRIGINSGSLPKHLINKYKNDKIKIMIEAAREEIGYFKKYGYDKIVLSFKSSNVIETIKINQLAKKEFDYPLHIGVTEAGDMLDGSIKNAIGISNLLLNRIGDTIRVSLTSKEEDEIIAAKKILEAIDKRSTEFEIISCPTCGRTETSIEQIVFELKKVLNNVKFKENIKIAVMGCMVNGPGEASEACFGVACGKDKSVIFKDGKKLKLVKNSDILDELLIMASNYYEK